MSDVVIRFERGRDGGNVPMIILWKDEEMIILWELRYYGVM